MTGIGGAARRLLSSYTLPYGGGRVIVTAVVVYATGSGLYLAGGTVFFVRGIHLSVAQVGLGLTVAGLVGFVTTVPVSLLAHRFGPRQVLRMVEVWRAACFAGLGFAHNFPMFVLFASLWAISQGPVLPMVQLIVGALGGVRNQTRSVGVVGSVSNVGMCIGAVAAAPFLAVGGIWMFRSIMLLAGLCCLASAAIYGLLEVPKTAQPDHPAPLRGRLLIVGRDRRYVGLTAGSSVLFLHTVLLSIGIPLWLVHSTDAPPSLLSALVTLNTVLAIVVQVQVAKRIRSSRQGIRALRRAGYFLAAFCVVLIASAHARSWLTIALLLTATVLLTLGELLQGAGGWELSYRHAPPALRTEYLSVFSLGGSAVAIVGPAIIALLLRLQASGLVALGVIFLATSAGVTALGARLADVELEEPGETAASPSSIEDLIAEALSGPPGLELAR